MTYEALPATLDGRRPCRNHSRCRRQAIPHSPLCMRCFHEAITAAFGQHVPERARVERLSSSMPELQVAGRPDHQHSGGSAPRSSAAVPVARHPGSWEHASGDGVTDIRG